jgi:hypothetical protein
MGPKGFFEMASGYSLQPAALNLLFSADTMPCEKVKTDRKKYSGSTSPDSSPETQKSGLPLTHLGIPMRQRQT